MGDGIKILALFIIIQYSDFAFDLGRHHNGLSPLCCREGLHFSGKIIALVCR